MLLRRITAGAPLRLRVALRILAAATTVVLTAALAPSCDAAATHPDAHRRVVRELGPELAIEWAQLAYDIAYGEDQFQTFRGQRAIAMMHLAMHDALQAVVPRYEGYAYRGRAPDADPLAAAATAAYQVLVATYADHREELEPLRDRWVNQARDDRRRAKGVEVGEAAARAILERRADDGWDVQGTYEFRTGPGEYQTTPPWDGFVLQPGFRAAKPFSFDDPARFRPALPPPLASADYARALDEVRVQGDSSSTVRSSDQTGYALWWMEFAEGSVGRLARRLLRERDVDLWAANRMLAHMFMALFDGYVSNWDSKYEHNHWRPYTAIRAADDDGNPSTVADADWVSLRAAPPFPEYASAHATGCAAAFEVMAQMFGNQTPFENTTLTAPPEMPTRRFRSFRAAAEECADSRVQLGWHFRYAIRAGRQAGRSVAEHVLRTTLQPRSARAR